MKNPAAVALGRLGGLKGGAARAAALSPEQRTESARVAAVARWGAAEGVSCVECRRVFKTVGGMGHHKCPGAAGIGTTRESQRSGRKRAVRSTTISVKRMTKREQELGELLYPKTDHYKPKSRAECPTDRPCPFVSCKYHLFLDVSPRTGSIKLNFPDLEPEELRNSCVLDVADRGGETLEEVGAILNVTRERMRQIEVAAFEKMRLHRVYLPLLRDFEHPVHAVPFNTSGVDDTESAPLKPAHTPATEAKRFAVSAEIHAAEASVRRAR